MRKKIIATPSASLPPKKILARTGGGAQPRVLKATTGGGLPPKKTVPAGKVAPRMKASVGTAGGPKVLGERKRIRRTPR